ncbi:hypothetical protein [Bacillus paranthracis]|uniref:hypothetical protein n=1 Tax=Bacillus paranthracis TaxID=2026186 RepID=UPI001374750E|nr:hypothetical protein [Bacillus paranthracis]MCU5211270.1 hypothetical protein [Bacillus paranthracis]
MGKREVVRASLEAAERAGVKVIVHLEPLAFPFISNRVKILRALIVYSSCGAFRGWLGG